MMSIGLTPRSSSASRQSSTTAPMWTTPAQRICLFGSRDMLKRGRPSNHTGPIPVGHWADDPSVALQRVDGAQIGVFKVGGNV